MNRHAWSLLADTELPDRRLDKPSSPIMHFALRLTSGSSSYAYGRKSISANAPPGRKSISENPAHKINELITLFLHCTVQLKSDAIS